MDFSFLEALWAATYYNPIHILEFHHDLMIDISF